MGSAGEGRKEEEKLCFFWSTRTTAASGGGDQSLILNETGKQLFVPICGMRWWTATWTIVKPQHCKTKAIYSFLKNLLLQKHTRKRTRKKNAHHDQVRRNITKPIIKKKTSLARKMKTHTCTKKTATKIKTREAQTCSVTVRDAD